MDWTDLLKYSTGALFTFLGVIVANWFAKQREERERKFREEQAALDRRERDARARADALRDHLRDVLQEMRDTEALLHGMSYEISLDNMIAPNAEWQKRFVQLRTRFDSALSLVPEVEQSSDLPEGSTMHFFTDNQGVFAGKARLMDFHKYSRRMDVAIRKVVFKLHDVYDSNEVSKQAYTTSFANTYADKTGMARAR